MRGPSGDPQLPTLNAFLRSLFSGAAFAVHPHITSTMRHLIIRMHDGYSPYFLAVLQRF